VQQGERPASAGRPNGAVVALEGEAFQRTLQRLAHEIAERNPGVDGLVLAGIQRGGAHMARRLGPMATAALGRRVAVGTLDVTMYRDDLDWRQLPRIEATELPGDLDGRVVVLVDDVIFRGRTIRAALDALHALGRPRAVQLAVMVDRGHRELPIRPDYVGKNLPTSAGQRVVVRFSEDGGRDEVILQEGNAK
jgi:pyrimidine operon attenuation protein / uracil phosphoribosyltransferase